jgi:hypothetical protein
MASSQLKVKFIAYIINSGANVKVRWVARAAAKVYQRTIIFSIFFRVKKET